ncbi:MAG: thiol-activated cytolysin family protein [Chloroflexi bacterium]|nr:thiol-activated cytolysin family protein [Chloroflexota bacterium]
MKYLSILFLAIAAFSLLGCDIQISPRSSVAPTPTTAAVVAPTTAAVVVPTTAAVVAPTTAAVAAPTTVAPAAQPPAAVVVPPSASTNLSVNVITVGDQGGKLLGTYEQTAPGQWLEKGANGAVVFSFKEVRRDATSIYINDATRNMSLQLDLKAMKVIYNNGVLYSILKTEANPSVVVPSSPDTSVSTAARSDAIRNIAITAGKPAAPKPATSGTTKLPDTVEGNFRYINEKHDDSKNVDSILHLGLNDDLIWPGNLIQGGQVNDFVYIPISTKRAPLTISISAEGSSNTSAGITEIVTAPELSTMRQGIANLLKKAIGPNTKLAARVDFSKEEVFSESQVNTALSAAVSYGVGSVKTDFSWDTNKNMHRIVAKYTQVYFTVDVNTPASPADVFDPAASIASIQAAMPQGSTPLYVSSVSYGMMALMFMESNFSAEEMKVAMDLAYKGAVDAKVNASYTSKQILQSSKLKVLVYGGSTAGLKNIEQGFDGFMKVIAASHTYSPDSPGVPISYRFRSLADNTLTFVALTSQYTLRRPLRIKQAVVIKVDRMICTLSDDEGSNNDADMDRFQITFTASNARIGGALVPINPINPGDAIIYDYSTSGAVTVNLGYIWDVSRSKNFTFDTDPATFDFTKAKITITGTSREYDTTGDDEYGSGSITVAGSEFFGQHKFPISSADSVFDVYITISPGSD